MAEPKVQRILKRLKLDPEFQALSTKAQTDPKNLVQYVNETRKRFNLSRYWEILLQHILMIPNFKETNLTSGDVIESEPDPITHRTMYKICVYPETTQKDVLGAYSLIAKRYKDRNYDIDIRDKGLDELEFRALQLHNKGKTHAEITEVLDKEFAIPIAKHEVPGLIRRAKEKSSR